MYVKIAHHSGAGQYIDEVDRNIDTTPIPRALVLASDRSSSRVLAEAITQIFTVV